MSFFLFLVFLVFSRRTKGNDGKWEFHSDPICTDPVQNFPIDSQKSPSRRLWQAPRANLPPKERQQMGEGKEKNHRDRMKEGIPEKREEINSSDARFSPHFPFCLPKKGHAKLFFPPVASLEQSRQWSLPGAGQKQHTPNDSSPSHYLTES